MSARSEMVSALTQLYAEFAGTDGQANSPKKYARQDVEEFVNEILLDHAQVIRMMAFVEDPKRLSVIGPYSSADLIDPDRP
jgi:hypothetical protein